jgi:hypothetical protein
MNCRETIKRVAVVRKEAEAAYNLALFVGWTTAAAGVLAALHIF